MATVNEFLDELEREAHATRRVLENVPPDQLAWKPHEKSMSLGRLAMHVARLPEAILELSMQPVFDVTTPIPMPEATGLPELLDAFEQSLARARTLLGGMTDAELKQPWRAVAGDQVVMDVPRGAMLRSILLNHWYHHRGQLTVYLRQTGARVPATYGNSADERPL
ncbi:MAG: DinB family protein [Gemmatimonadales bacterium]